MKKVLSVLLVVVFLVTNLGFGVFAEQKINVRVDGKIISFPDAEPMIDSNGRTLIPVRFVAEELGATVGWDGDTKQITITRGERELQLRIGSKYLSTKYGIKAMDTEAIIVSGRTFVPIRFVAEGLGATVGWEGSTRTVLIQSQDIDTIEGGDEKYLSRYTNLKPMLGVPEDQEFTFKFNSNLFKGPLTSTGYVQVYSDAACKNRIAVETNADYKDYTWGTITVKPPKVSDAPRTFKNRRQETGRSWGGHNKYYIVIDRDMESQEYRVLSKPIRIMFTVASEAEIPSLKFKISKDGLATLYWDKVKGASEYRIYKAPYIYDSSSLELLSTTKSTEYSDFTDEKYSGSRINGDFDGAYYVTAVVGGKESRISNEIDSLTVKKQVPEWMTEYIYNGSTVDNLDDLPQIVPVRMKDYTTIKNYKIKWDYENLEMREDVIYGFMTKRWKIEYTVPGTPFKGIVYIREVDQNLLKELQGRSKEETSNSGIIEPENNIKDNPPSEIKNDISDNVIEMEQQLPEELPTQTLGSRIAQAMLNNETEISLASYPEAQDGTYLKDIILKIIAQNPYILYESSFQYDYISQTLIIEYDSSMVSTASKKQLEMKAKAKKVVSEQVKPTMSDYEKEKVLHDYLMDHGRYDYDALKAAEANNFSKVPSNFNDSFNAYGILINGVGVCQSYAEAYKILCEEAGLECIVVTGMMNNVPHAWNKVKLNGVYYHVDVTNNDNDGLVLYPVFNASDITVRLDFTEDTKFALDNELKDFECLDNSQDFYTKQNLSVISKQELKSKIVEQLSKGSKFNVKIMNEDIAMSDIEQAIQEIANAGGFTSIKAKMFASVLYGEAIQ